MCGWKSGFGEWKFLSVGSTINYSFFILKNKTRLGKEKGFRHFVALQFLYIFVFKGLHPLLLIIATSWHILINSNTADSHQNHPTL